MRGTSRTRRIVVGCLCGLTAALSASPAAADLPLPRFFEDLCGESLELRSAEFVRQLKSLCAAHDLDTTSAGNVATFHQVSFLHDLLTTSMATDCARGGILRIPYFWHWTEPNPRHEILLLPDSVALSSLPPPAQYDQYRTRADIDRVPALYLGDLVTEAPQYVHPGCGAFYTFGWCSEREMAFTALMTLLGYEAKIEQSGIHTWSALWCPLRGADGGSVVLEATVDNTFDNIHWERVPDGTSLFQWRARIGEGQQIEWYNRRARSEQQLDALRSLHVPPTAAERIREQVADALAESQ